MDFHFLRLVFDYFPYLRISRRCGSSANDGTTYLPPPPTTMTPSTGFWDRYRNKDFTTTCRSSSRRIAATASGKARIGPSSTIRPRSGLRPFGDPEAVPTSGLPADDSAEGEQSVPEDRIEPLRARLSLMRVGSRPTTPVGTFRYTEDRGPVADGYHGRTTRSDSCRCCRPSRCRGFDFDGPGP